MKIVVSCSPRLNLVSLFFQAYDEVQGFLNSSLPTSLVSDLSVALDSKCRAIEKLSASLKDLIVGKSTIGHLHFSCQSDIAPTILILKIFSATSSKKTLPCCFSRHYRARSLCPACCQNGSENKPP